MKILHYAEEGFDEIHVLGFESETDLINTMLSLSESHGAASEQGYPAFLIVFDPNLSTEADKAYLERARKQFIDLRTNIQGEKTNEIKQSTQAKPVSNRPNRKTKRRGKAPRRKGGR